MQPHDLGDLLAHGQQRVQAAHRLLEDHADPLPRTARIANSDNSSRSRPAEPYDAIGDRPRRCRYQTHDGQRGHRLAAARLPYDRQARPPRL